MGKKKGRGNGGGNVGTSDQNGGGNGENVQEKMKNKETKTEGGPITIVLKVDMHCEGCSKKVMNSVRGIEGIEKATVDVGSNKLTVVGTVDPIWIRDRVHIKTRKLVELITPVAKKNQGDSNRKENEKPKEPQAATVVLKIGLHCEGCTQRIRKKIIRVKGVTSVSVDTEKDLVTVKGIMDVKSLPQILKEKLKRPVDIVLPKKEKDGEKKEKKGEEEKKENGGCNKDGEAKKMEYCYGEYGIPPYYYYMNTVPAPQLFSDENPNNCIIL